MALNFRLKFPLFFGIVFALALYLSQRNLRQDWDDLLETADVLMDNFNYSLRPERSRSISAIEQETKLKSFVGEPFLSFQQSDWDKFWNILYGAYPLDYSDNRRLPPRVRQLNYPEMEAKLKEFSPNPFSYFQEEHWRQFWPIVFGKKARPR